jgi:hypothetical protein
LLLLLKPHVRRPGGVAASSGGGSGSSGDSSTAFKAGEEVGPSLREARGVLMSNEKPLPVLLLLLLLLAPFPDLLP